MNIVVLTLSSLDNDSRVKKIIRSLKTLPSNGLTSVSIESKIILEDISNIIVHHKERRMLGVPGLSMAWLYLKCIFEIKKNTNKIDIWYCNDLIALPLAVVCKLFSFGNSKIIYDCHEYETEVNGLTGVRKLIKKLEERLLISFADEVITVSDSIAIEYRRLYAIPKPHLVLNCPPYVDQVKRNLFREYFGIRPDQLIFLYQGGLSRGRGIEILLNAFVERSDDRCVFVCMGYGPLESTVQSFSQRSSVIFYHPAVDQTVLLNHTSSADFGILFYEDTCLNHRYCSPNKIFEYLMAGIPVLTSNLYEMRRLVESESVGLVAESNDQQGFKKALERALGLNTDEMRRNVQRVRQQYCWEKQEKVLEYVYANL